MIVCQCKGTTEAAVRKAIRAGASTVAEIGCACLAGTDCGGCHETLVKILSSERPDERAEPAGGLLLQPVSRT